MALPQFALSELLDAIRAGGSEVNRPGFRGDSADWIQAAALVA